MLTEAEVNLRFVNGMDSSHGEAFSAVIIASKAPFFYLSCIVTTSDYMQKTSLLSIFSAFRFQMRIFLFQWMSCYVHAGLISVPFHMNERGMPQVFLGIPALIPDAVYPFGLVAGGGTSAVIDSWMDDYIDQVIMTDLVFPDASPPFNLPHLDLLLSTSLDARFCRAQMMARASRNLGIGLGSVFVTRFNSVDFLSSRRVFILNDMSENEFRNNCEPESIMRIPFAHSQTQADWLMTVGIHQDPEEAFRTSIEITDEEQMLQVSPYILRPILHTIAGYLQQDGRIGNCMYVRSQLWEIQLRIMDPSNRDHPYAGTIVLRPDDYTRLHADGTCTFLIGTHVADLGRARINPLLLPGMNARFTHQQIALCDSRSS